MSSLIVLDIGTSSVRAFVINDKFQILSSFSKPLSVFYPKIHWVEQDPLELFIHSKECLLNVIDKININHVKGICITNQRETTILWDKNTSKPVYPAIVWQCRRSADICNNLQNFSEPIKAKTGLLLDPYFSASKIKWIFDNNSSLYSKANNNELLFGTVDTWIIWNLTNKKYHITDYSNASRTMLFNIHSLSYDNELLNLFSIPKSILPNIVDSTGELAFTDANQTQKSLPIVGILGDQQASLFAQTNPKENHIKNTYGTGMFVVANTGSHIPSCPSLINTIAWKYKNTLNYAVEGSIFSGGSTISWMSKSLKLFPNVSKSEKLAKSVPDTAGVYFRPALNGLGAPYWDANASALFCGLSPSSSNAHLCRAVLESLAYRVKDIIDIIKTLNKSVTYTKLFVDGGVTNNSFLMQFQADILQMKVLLSSQLESTTFGVFGLAGIFLNLFDEKEYRMTLKHHKTYTPRINKEDATNLYNNWKKAIF